MLVIAQYLPVAAFAATLGQILREISHSFKVTSYSFLEKLEKRRLPNTPNKQSCLAAICEVI